jgi:hypothetical protein
VRRIFTILSVLVATAASAQVEEGASPGLRDIASARNLAMGGAYESLGYGAEVINGNPAALSLYKRYQIELNGAWDIPQGYANGSLALADSTNPLAMGISYNFATFSDPGGTQRRWAHLTTLALSYAIADWIHLGVTTRHHVLVGASNTNSISMNAGLVIRPVEFLTFGFSGHNLIPVYNRDVSRYFVASVSALILGQLTPIFDLRMDFEPTAKFAFHGGLEWLISQTFPVRIGYQYDGIMNHQYLSAGVGWFNQGSGIDFAYRHELGGQEGRLIALTLKLQL